MKNYTFLSFIAFLLLVSVLFIGCDNNDGNKSPTAVLTATESSLVPGRVVLDASDSFDTDGNITSYTFEIEDLNGDTVAGPTTSFDVPEGAVDSVILPPGDYIAFLTVTDDKGRTDSTDVPFSHDSDVVFSPVSTSVLALKVLPGVQARNFLGADVTCSRFSGDTLITCVLGAGTSSVDLFVDVLEQAGLIDSRTNSESIMWIQAWGAKGGNGDDRGVGCSFVSGCPGAGGLGGFAQTQTDQENFVSRTGTNVFFYYLGKAGTHSDDLGGKGGTSTLVTFKNLENTSTSDLNLENDVILIAGGGGGGGTDSAFHDGTDGTRGGAAISSILSASFGAGDNSNKCTGGSDSGAGMGVRPVTFLSKVAPVGAAATGLAAREAQRLTEILEN